MIAGRDRLIPRSMCPVFVMGCHRSGTNLLYDTLLSAGGFAVYRGYLPVYKLLIPRFGSLENLENRKNLMKIWVRSKGFRRSGLEAEQLTAKVLSECRNGGDFIRITMDEIAKHQNVTRWAVYDPDNIAYVPRIKADTPEALFVHIIRDGRDIALSLKKMGGFRPFPWHRRPGTLKGTALYWEWVVRKARDYGRQIPADYIEVHYEDLVSEPRQTLATLSKFLDHDLDAERINRAGLGRVRESNSSFLDSEERHNPVHRWKEKLTHSEIVGLESLIGGCLEEVGYTLTTSDKERRPTLRDKWLRTLYASFFDAKLWLKIETPLGRLSSLAPLEMSPSVSAPEPSQASVRTSQE